MAFQQHHTGGSHVERKAQQCGNQQDGWKYSEIQNLDGMHAYQQDHNSYCNIEGEQNIKQNWRQWQHHHRQDHHNQRWSSHAAQTNTLD